MKLSYEIFDQISHVFSDLPKTTNQLVKQEMVRFAKRFQKMFIKTHLSGPAAIPGDDGYSILAKGKLSKGGNFQTWVEGDDVSNFVFKAKISRILRTHEEGADIPAVNFPYLSIGSRSIYVQGVHTTKFALKDGMIRKVSKVHIPARIHFRAEFNNSRADLMQRINKAMARAVEVSNDRNMARIQRMTY